MNDRSKHSSGHLGAKLGEVVEATLQIAPHFALMSFAQMSLSHTFSVAPSLINDDCKNKQSQ
jgi:hypothetical protein